MYLLDTNVLSELRKAKADRANHNVVKWASQIPISSLFISAITILEIETGILLVERRDKVQGLHLRTWINEHVFPSFADRILPLDVAVAQQCAQLHVPDPVSDRDAMIAATALVYGMILSTRNTHDFDKTAVALLNPWEAQSQ